ncbi:hypothetical protein [Azohydromonas lata]|uniref:Lipoprotein n=1 Tax=Azohydromonas lata TaxID=45677 RepID=A0ABU5IJ14_9BURK|nr:hypothetical protein [Azohydromonas lata]MDZ5458855.1 hypothetical protein [Azohydromonas lata]
MKSPAMLLPPLLAILAGCAQTTPGWDERFGDSVRQARAQQTIDPAAGQRAAALAGLDGKASVGVMRALGISYGYSLREPAPPALVITLVPGTPGGQ